MKAANGRSLPLLVGLISCGSATAGVEELSFDLRHVEVGHETASVLILDQNADGFLDLLVIGGGRLTVLRGDGSGDFVVHEVVDAGEHPVDLAAGDLDQDGRIDVAIANHETSYVTLLFGGRDGFTSGGRARLPIDVSPHPHAVAVVDLSDDGRLDLVVDDRDRERLTVLLGRGDRSFDTAGPIPVGGDPYRGMTVADINGDGHLDVVTPNPRTVSVQLGDGTGAFSPGPQLRSRAVPPFSTAVGDFDGDGLPDIVAGSGEGRGAVAVWLKRGDGTFDPAPDSAYEIAAGPTRLSTGDLNGDSVEDVLVTSYLGNEVAVLLGGREGLRVIRIELEDNPWDVAAGDLNRDGRTDLVTAHDGGPRISLLLGRAQ